ncbi:hypothetical protein [Streptomyces flavidovirens]|uniref:hypothetical protein n=1 Tax=Streptomyces flavidovirens TaxID=67298 RepID=UPI0036AF4F38
MSDHEQQQPAPRRGKILAALARAERKVFTRPTPKSAKAQMEVLYTHAKRSTKALAERLGVSTRTVQRGQAGAVVGVVRAPGAGERGEMGEGGGGEGDFRCSGCASWLSVDGDADAFEELARVQLVSLCEAVEVGGNRFVGEGAQV